MLFCTLKDSIQHTEKYQNDFILGLIPEKF